MTRLLKYLLPLCLLVSSGFFQLEGQAIEQAATNFSEQIASFSTADETTVRAYNHSENDQRNPIDFEQEEEDETETSKEDSVSNGNSSEIHASNLFLGVEKRLILSKYATCFLSCKSLYILFEVFRI